MVFYERSYYKKMKNVTILRTVKLRIQVGIIHRNPKFQSQWVHKAGAKGKPDPGSVQSVAPERKELHDRHWDPFPRCTRRIHSELGRVPYLQGNCDIESCCGSENKS